MKPSKFLLSSLAILSSFALVNCSSKGGGGEGPTGETGGGAQTGDEGGGGDPVPPAFASTFSTVFDGAAYGEISGIVVANYPITLSAWINTTATSEQTILAVARSSSSN